MIWISIVQMVSWGLVGGSDARPSKQAAMTARTDLAVESSSAQQLTLLWLTAETAASSRTPHIYIGSPSVKPASSAFGPSPQALPPAPAVPASPASPSTPSAHPSQRKGPTHEEPSDSPAVDEPAELKKELLRRVSNAIEEEGEQAGKALARQLLEGVKVVEETRAYEQDPQHWETSLGSPGGIESMIDSSRRKWWRGLTAQQQQKLTGSTKGKGSTETPPAVAPESLQVSSRLTVRLASTLMPFRR